MKGFSLAAWLWCGAFLAGGNAFAAGGKCEAVLELARKLGCADVLREGYAEEKTREHFTGRDSFGPTDCLAGEVLEEATRKLKAGCDAWLAGQRQDLGSRFVTGACSKKCDPCAGGQDRCRYHGEVHYQFQNKPAPPP